MSEPIQCTVSRMSLKRLLWTLSNSDVSMSLHVINTYCGAVIRIVGEAMSVCVGNGMWELLAQFCCQPKTALEKGLG
jgi:hypothetical protein